MKHFISLSILCAFLCACMAYVVQAQTSTVEQAVSQVKAEPVLSQAKAEKVLPQGVQDTPEQIVSQDAVSAEDSKSQDAIGLVLRNILLSQGDDGNELWRLQASYANMAIEGDITTVDAPIIRYTLGDPALQDYIYVTAKKGQIKDNQRFLLLWDDVHVKRADQNIVGPKMVYDAKTRTMEFPDGAVIESPAGVGTAKTLSWKLDDNILRAVGAVNVRIFEK